MGKLDEENARLEEEKKVVKEVWEAQLRERERREKQRREKDKLEANQRGQQEKNQGGVGRTSSGDTALPSSIFEGFNRCRFGC